ncbi:MAG TPA: hypothetical protein PLN21_06600 [Gemmatales bacterium]|nr:hypothetical protein [Gemmatales bacterium]
MKAGLLSRLAKLEADININADRCPVCGLNGEPEMRIYLPDNGRDPELSPISKPCSECGRLPMVVIQEYTQCSLVSQ